MAPTVCLTELPMTGSTVCPYVCQRQRVQNSTNIKRQILRLRQMLRNASKTPPMSQGNSLWRLEYANIEDCFISNRIRDFSTNMDEHTEKLVMAKKDLTSIIIRTIILMQRDHILQRRLNALRADTWRFLNSVLNNSENNYQQRKVQKLQSGNEAISSSTEKIVTISSSSLNSNLTSNSFHEITSTCGNHDRINDKSSDKPENLIVNGW